MKIFKILTSQQLEHLKSQKSFSGTSHDLQDGFIHLCTKSQLKVVLAKHYQEFKIVHVVELESEDFEYNIKWEPASDNELYPHLYSTLELHQVKKVTLLSL